MMKIETLLQQAKEQDESASREVSSATCAGREYSDAGRASIEYDRFREKLFHIDEWREASGVSDFTLFDENGAPVDHKEIRDGYFIRIYLPGTLKYDWVKIVDIYDSDDEIVVTVRPSFDPTLKDPDHPVTSHFFTDEATNNFCLRRTGPKLEFYVIGLGEKSNISDTGGVLETVRNFAAANFGRYLGIQKGEWTKFCESFLEKEEESGQ
jgi:hypothetical protein